jgi:hypothetical protein
MRYRTIFPRCALVYLGGMRAIRWFGRLASAICVGCAVAFAWSALAFGRLNVVVVVAVYLGAVVAAVGNRLAKLHSVALSTGGWMLLPLVGRPKSMAPVTEVYERGDDVIALGIDGSTTVLGVDRLPFRDGTVTRRSLVQALRGTAAL